MKGVCLTVCLLLLLLPMELHGLNCHVCGTIGSLNAACDDPFTSTSSPTNCGGDTCKKVKYSGTGIVIRSCSTSALCQESDILNVVTKCCTGESCNSGTKIGSSIIMLLLPLIATFVGKGAL